MGFRLDILMIINNGQNNLFNFPPYIIEESDYKMVDISCKGIGYAAILKPAVHINGWSSTTYGSKCCSLLKTALSYRP